VVIVSILTVENYTFEKVKSFKYLCVILTQYCAGGKIKKNEMGRACGAYGGGERCAQGFGGEA
jgi:hypothetical protein